MSDTAPLFPGFERVELATDGARIAALVGGAGPPVLLLHGYPQTHAAWHRIAPVLARSHRVVVPDLRGYGQSRAHLPAEVASFAKAALALDQVELMDHLGFDRFAVVGHDRGGRVGYRLALDHPERVSAFASLTVIPTVEMWDRADKGFGLGAYHWFLLAQPYDLPERLIGVDPGYFLDYTLDRMAGDAALLDPRALDSYRRAFDDPAVRHAMCQDYRASAGLDDARDRADRDAGRSIACPVLILWTDRRAAGSGGETPLDIWRGWARDVTGHPIASGHLMPELAHEAVLETLLPFLARAAQPRAAHHQGS